MYAAAGGASLASRQARQRAIKNKKPPQSSQKATDLPAPKQPKQFPNYTDHAIIIPSRLSRVERNALLKPPPGGGGATATPGAGHHHTGHDRRHSTSNYHLKEPHPKGRLRESPSICIPVQKDPGGDHVGTPLSPCTLVHHHHHQHHNHLPLPAGAAGGGETEGLLRGAASQLQLPQVHIPEDGDKTLERRCSFVRQVEEMEKGGGEAAGGILDRCHHMCNFDLRDEKGDRIGGDGGRFDHMHEGGGMYYGAECEKSVFGSLDYPFSECSQGRAAWQERERGRRCSLSDEARQQRLKQSEAHHRWMKRNRIHDTTYGGSSDDEDLYDAYYQSAAANALLYVGLGTSALGSIIFFVGTGDKGFKTLELRMIGPTLVACGLLCCLIRILLCACPSNCGSAVHHHHRRRKKGGSTGGGTDGGSGRMKNVCPHSTSGNRLLTMSESGGGYQHHAATTDEQGGRLDGGGGGSGAKSKGVGSKGDGVSRSGTREDYSVQKHNIQESYGGTMTNSSSITTTSATTSKQPPTNFKKKVSIQPLPSTSTTTTTTTGTDANTNVLLLLVDEQHQQHQHQQPQLHHHHHHHPPSTSRHQQQPPPPPHKPPLIILPPANSDPTRHKQSTCIELQRLDRQQPPPPPQPAWDHRANNDNDIDIVLDEQYELQSVSSADSETVIEVPKHVRTREPVNVAPNNTSSSSVVTVISETSLMTNTTTRANGGANSVSHAGGTSASVSHAKSSNSSAKVVKNANSSSSNTSVGVGHACSSNTSASVNNAKSSSANSSASVNNATSGSGSGSGKSNNAKTVVSSSVGGGGGSVERHSGIVLSPAQLAAGQPLQK